MTGNINYCQHCVEWALHQCRMARAPFRLRLQARWLRYLDLTHGR